MRTHSTKAFSMVEVIVASIILMSTIMLVFGTIANTRQPVVQSSRKLRAATYAQEVLDTLRGRINDNTWRDDAGLLSSGTHNLGDVIPSPEGVSGTYDVDDAQDGYRKVTVNVTYNDTL